MHVYRVENFKSTVQPLLAKLGTTCQSFVRHIGLDIGSSMIKVVELRYSAGEWQLINFGVKQVLTEKDKQGNTDEENNVKEALKYLIAETRIEGTHVAVSISGPSVIMKPIEIPRMSQEELEGHLELEVERYLPYEREDIYWDYFVTQWPTPSRSSSMLVYLVAAKKDVVNRRVELVKESGLHPVVVDVDCVALANMYSLNYENEVHAPEILVNIGPSGLNMITVGTPGYISMRDAVLGGEWSHEVLEETSRLMLDDEVVSESQVNKPKSLYVLLEEVYKEMVNEIRRTMDDSDSIEKGRQIQQIWLSGGYAHLPRLGENLSLQLHVPVKVVDPFHKMKIAVPAHKNNMFNSFPSLAAVATGLAMRCGQGQ